MKHSNKILLTCLMILSLFIFTGCKDTNEDVETEQPQVVEPQEEVVEFNEEEFMQAVMPALEYMRSCELEEFGAEVNFEEAYLAGYVEGNDQPAIMYSVNENTPEGYLEDPAYASYYLVSNFKTLQELIDYSANYIVEGKVPNQELINYDFIEFDGQLYLCRGGRGYGAFVSELESVEYAGEENGLQVVTMDYYVFYDEMGQGKVYFDQQEDGTWQIVDIVKEEIQ